MKLSNVVCGRIGRFSEALFHLLSSFCDISLPPLPPRSLPPPRPPLISIAVGDDCVPEVRLADFGSAFRQHRPLSGAKDCTLAYSAPEVLACQDVDEKVDMWALGVVMWVLLTGRHPFDTDVDMSEEEVAYRVTHEEPDLRVRTIVFSVESER